MTKERTGDAWMPADEYGRAMPKFSLNLLVREVERSLPFYKNRARRDCALRRPGFRRAESAGRGFYAAFPPRLRPSPLFERLKVGGARGTGAELRVMGIDPDVVEKRAQAAGAKIIQPAMDFPYGWRDVMLEDPDGYIGAVGVAIPR